MASFVACIGEGKGTWGVVAKLLRAEPWEHVYLVCASFAAEKFQAPNNGELIILDEEKPLAELVAELTKRFDGKFFGDVAVNIASGSGKLHMAMLAALLKSGAGIRLVEPSEEGGAREV